jgi:hypothetical protein
MKKGLWIIGLAQLKVGLRQEKEKFFLEMVKEVGDTIETWEHFS